MLSLALILLRNLEDVRFPLQVHFLEQEKGKSERIPWISEQGEMHCSDGGINKYSPLS